MKELRHHFITGVATMLPLSVTVFIFWFIVVRLGSLFRPLFRLHPWLERLPEWVSVLVGFVFLLIVVLAIGALASGFLGRIVLGWLDKLMNRTPIVKTIYSSARQLTNAVFTNRSSLSRTVLAEYPRKGVYAVGFLTHDDRITLPNGRSALFVFFPTTPNPTSGWLALIPENEVTQTSLSIEEGLKLVVSGGVIKPDNLNACFVTKT